MEDAYRTHKGNSSFGWLLLIEEWLTNGELKRRARERAAWRESRLRARRRGQGVMEDRHAGPR